MIEIAWEMQENSQLCIEKTWKLQVDSKIFIKRNAIFFKSNGKFLPLHFQSQNKFSSHFLCLFNNLEVLEFNILLLILK